MYISSNKRKFQESVSIAQIGNLYLFLLDYLEENSGKENSMRAGVIVYNPFLDKILLIHRWKNGQEYLVIPGGTIELGEGPLEAALREMKEEVNLSFSADQLYLSLIHI